MMVEKKCWPKFFEAVLEREKNVEVRLADFPLKEGDTLRLLEWDPATEQYTGRSVDRKVGKIFKVDFTAFGHTPYQMKHHGHYVIEFEYELRCPIWQCGGVMHAVEWDREDEAVSGWQVPILKCGNCGAIYQFIRFDKENKYNVND